MNGPDHLLGIAHLTPDDLRGYLKTAVRLKAGGHGPLLAGKSVALLFQKPSLRTRASFDVGLYQLGAHGFYLAPAEVGLGEREAVQDVARVLSRYVDAIVARTFSQADVEMLAQYATVPVVNGLSDQEHPCQALADLLTILEKRGRLEGVALAFIGDGNNIATSLMLAGSLAGMHVRLAVPAGYEPPAVFVQQATKQAVRSGGSVTILPDPRAAAAGADVLYTDVWTSMGHEAEAELRREVFAGYQINDALLALAKPNAIVMHDLPAHRGEEITDDAIDGPQSAVFDQAENRLHAQKGVLVTLLDG
ncbi:MAG: ornithine carbamoyltransferase [Chloroflexi bacterium]|nr:ornithine carbamoyltransferase [Chloroflexota bacterium]